MATWKEFSLAEPELAAYGTSRLKGNVAYLATVRADGSPRVHPVTPIISDNHLFLFMEPTSPKGNDLKRDERYALHCGVENNSGGSGEFYIHGKATYIADTLLRDEAIRASTYQPKEHYILFQLTLENVASTIYTDSETIRRKWSQS